MNKKLFLKTVVSIIALAVIGACTFWAYRTFLAQTGGTIRIVITDEHNNNLKNDVIEYRKGDTLVSILSEHYECTLENGMLLSLDELKTPTDWSYFICIYVNGEMSAYGINELEFKDKDVISFVLIDASTYE
jgi:hypothetical protein